MNPLQYTSEEMFSSTELIRKSKMVFDKLQKNDIEKAIILRDGKPSFMLLAFAQYEEMMSEYIALKEMLDNQPNKKQSSLTKKTINEPISRSEDETFNSDLEEDDFEKALAKIDELDLDALEEKTENDEKVTSKEELKEFWE